MEAAADRPLPRIRVLADLSVPAVLRDVVLPYLAGLGEHWQRGTASVAMVHFATNVIPGRLAGLGRGWGWGSRHRSQALEPRRAEHADLALRVPLALAGAGATAQIADAAGARLRAGDPVTEAERAGWPR
jgi:hypothetical protein